MATSKEKVTMSVEKELPLRSYLQNFPLREDGTFGAFQVRKFDPAAPRKNSDKVGSYVDMPGQPSFGEKMQKLHHIAFNAAQEGNRFIIVGGITEYQGQPMLTLKLHVYPANGDGDSGSNGNAEANTETGTETSTETESESDITPLS